MDRDIRSSQGGPYLEIQQCNVVALHLAELFKQLEAHVKADSLETASDVFQQITGEYGRVQQALRDELKGSSPC